MDMIDTTLSSSFVRKGNSSDDQVVIVKTEVQPDSPKVYIESSLSLKEDSEGESYRVLEFDESGMEQLAGANNMNATNVPTLINGSTGQFYVISDATPGQQRNVLPRTSDTVVGSRHIVNSREEKRRVTHNEVERRRRDKINNWIGRLAKILPDCPEMHHKNSQVLSKGGILAKACETITEMRHTNDQLVEKVKSLQRQDTDSEILHQEFEILKNENIALKNANAIMKARLHQHGLLQEDMSS